MEAILFYGFFCVLVSVAAAARGRFFLNWLVISAIITPLLAIIWILVVPSRKQTDDAARRRRASEPFTPDGFYAGNPYRVERDGSVTLLASGREVKFKSFDDFQRKTGG